MTSFGSFLNWATGSSNSISLLGKSTQSVWVAHQILLTEQYNREIKTGLWHEILKELSTQPNISLDTAIKVYFIFFITFDNLLYIFNIFLASLYHCKNATIWNQWIIYISLVTTSSRYTYRTSYSSSFMAKFFCFISCKSPNIIRVCFIFYTKNFILLFFIFYILVFNI